MESYSRGNSSKDLDLSVCPVDPEGVNTTWELLQHHPVVKGCRECLLRYVLSDGISVKSHSEEHPLDEDEGSSWSSHEAEEIISRSLDWMLTVGVVPVTRVKKEEGTRLMVLPPGTGSIRSICDGTQQHFRWVSAGKHVHVLRSLPREDESNVVVLSGWGFDPLPANGALTSPLASLLNSYRSYLSFLQCTQEAEQFRARPPMILQERPENPQREMLLGIDYNIVGHAENPHRPRECDKYYRTPQQLQELRRVNKFLEKEYYGLDNESREANLLESSIRIPSTYEIVNPSYPTLRTDLVSLKKSFEEEIFMAMGVPQVLIHSQGVHNGAQSTNEDHFRQTIRAWKRKLESIVTFAYRISIGVEQMDRLMKHAMRRGTPPTPSELAELDSSVEVRCVLPTAPFTSLEETLTMFQHGIVSHAEMVNVVRQQKGLPPLSTKAIKALEAQRAKLVEEQSPGSKGTRSPSSKSTS